MALRWLTAVRHDRLIRQYYVRISSGSKCAIKVASDAGPRVQDNDIAEREKKQHGNQCGDSCREQPDPRPVMRPGASVHVRDGAGDLKTNPQPNSVGRQRYQPLCGAAVPFACPRIGVDLPGDEEEIVAGTVQGDAGKQK